MIIPTEEIISLPFSNHETQQHRVYMSCAEEFSKLSKATRAKVGAVLVTKQGVVIPGVNGTPSGTSNDCETTHNWKDGGFSTVTNPEVIHAELNCLLKAAKEGVSVLESQVFVTHAPCIKCASMLVQSGVRKVYYNRDYKDDSGVQYLCKNKVSVTQIKD